MLGATGPHGPPYDPSLLLAAGTPRLNRNEPWTLGMLVPVRRAKRVLLVVGICVALAGGMDLSCPGTSPKAFSQSVSPEAGQSLFVWVAMTGALNRQGLILICAGLACLAVAWVLPSGRE